jgi:peptidoglycan/LPS O-acetylase OafA/YrhL
LQLSLTIFAYAAMMGYQAPFNVTGSHALARPDVSTSGNKLLGLELLRFVCAFAVLLWHYRHFYRIAGAPEFVKSAQPWHAPLSPFYDYGLFGVQLFWGISGFIFFWKYGNVIGRGAIGGAKFFWLRFSRLYPLHLATLLLVAILQPVHIALTGESFIYHENDLPSFAAQLAMATHWLGPERFTFNGPTWSVSAEVFVYALFFLLVRRFGLSWLLVCGAAAASIAAQMAGLVSPALFCATYFFVGGVAARLFLEVQASVWGEWMFRVSGLALGTIVLSIWLSGTPLDRNTTPLILLVALPPLLLVAAHDWPIPERWQTAIAGAGNLTYSSYLSHFPLQLVVAIGCAAMGLVPPLQSPIFLVAYVGATLFISRWLFEQFERPAQKWIRKVTVGRQLAVA